MQRPITDRPVVLASRSPRRRALLRQIGLRFTTEESGVDETFDPAATAAENVERLALRKAEAVARRHGDAIIIGADTTVVLNGIIFGKPADEEEAVHMLGALSGRTHEVYTGFALVEQPSGRSATGAERTLVTFRELAADEIRAYVRSGAPMDKAGAYGIQDDYGAVFVSRIEGDFYNVVGFPLTRFFTTLRDFLE